MKREHAISCAVFVRKLAVDAGYIVRGAKTYKAGERSVLLFRFDSIFENHQGIRVDVVNDRKVVGDGVTYGSDYRISNLSPRGLSGFYYSIKSRV